MVERIERRRKKNTVSRCDNADEIGAGTHRRETKEVFPMSRRETKTITQSRPRMLVTECRGDDTREND